MSRRILKRFVPGALLAGSISACAPALPYIISSNDQKTSWDDDGKQLFHPPGNDSISVIDITTPEEPRIVTNLPLSNSVVGPPNNVAISPDRRLALVSDSLDWVKEGDSWKSAPGNRVHVIDLAGKTPTHVSTVELEKGTQPSGIAIAPSGRLALVANRAAKSVTVLSIQGRDVKVGATIPMGEEVAAIAIAPDGKRALVTKFGTAKLAVLYIDGDQVAANHVDVTVGAFPYPVAITPDGKLGLVGNLGARTGSDGFPDTVTVLDMEVDPPVAIDRIEVGDAPEGLAISPDGKLAAVVLLMGGNAAKTAPYYSQNGKVMSLKIEGKKVTLTGESQVKTLPEGATFSPDGKYLYVGNFLTSDITVLRVDDDRFVETGKTLALPGRPGALR